MLENRLRLDASHGMPTPRRLDFNAERSSDSLLASAADPLSASQLAEFKKNGFLAIAQPIVSDDELSTIRSTLMRLIQQRAGWKEGAQFDLVADSCDPAREQATPQILEPSHFAPELRTLAYRAAALGIARQLLGAEASLCFEHAIVKSAGSLATTPWHQDEAYRPSSNLDYPQISIWLALQDVNLDNGCMQYLPVSENTKVLPHQPANANPRVHALECVGAFEPARAQPCPLPRGGAAIHGGLTLHFSGPNRSANPRYAYVLEFALPPRQTEVVCNHDWNDSTQAASHMRRRKWLSRGGHVISLYRKLRYAPLTKSQGFAGFLRRIIRFLRRF